jgi:hypothetical protein
LLQFLATVRLSDILPAIAIPSGKA